MAYALQDVERRPGYTEGMVFGDVMRGAINAVNVLRNPAQHPPEAVSAARKGIGQASNYLLSAAAIKDPEIRGAARQFLHELNYEGLRQSGALDTMQAEIGSLQTELALIGSGPTPVAPDGTVPARIRTGTFEEVQRELEQKQAIYEQATSGIRGLTRSHWIGGDTVVDDITTKSTFWGREPSDKWRVSPKVASWPVMQGIPHADWVHEIVNLQNPVQTDEGGRRYVDTSRGREFIPDYTHRKDQIRQAMLGQWPGTAGAIQRGQLLEEGAARLADLVEPGIRNKAHGQTAIAGINFPVTPLLFDGENGWHRSSLALQDPRSLRAVLEVAEELEQEGDLHPRWFESMLGMGTSLGEFITLNRMVGAGIGRTFQGAESLAVARNLKTAPFLLRSSKDLWHGLTGGPQGRYWTGLEFGVRDTWEEVVYAVTRNLISGEGDIYEGALEGLAEGALEAAIHTGFGATRSLAYKGMQRFRLPGHETLRRFAEARKGISSYDYYAEAIKNRPSTNLQLRDRVEDLFTDGMRAEQFLKMMDAVVVGAVFGGYENAVRAYGSEWDSVPAHMVPYEVARRMASPEAIGNMLVFAGAGAGFSAAQRAGWGDWRQQNEAAAAELDRITLEIVQDVANPDLGHIGEYAQIFDRLRENDPDLFAGVDFTTPHDRPHIREFYEVQPDLNRGHGAKPQKQEARSEENREEMRRFFYPAVLQLDRETGEMSWTEDEHGSNRWWVMRDGPYAVRRRNWDGTWVVVHRDTGEKAIDDRVKGTAWYEVRDDAMAQAVAVAQKKGILPPYLTGKKTVEEMTLEELEAEVEDSVERLEQMRVTGEFANLDLVQARLPTVIEARNQKRAEAEGGDQPPPPDDTPPDEPPDVGGGDVPSGSDPSPAPPGSDARSPEPEIAAESLLPESLDPGPREIEVEVTPDEPPGSVDEAPVALSEGVSEAIIPTEDILADPARFQFKRDVDPETGASERFANVTEWRPEFAGNLTVWQDNEGTYWVADGHHRLDLAKRLGVPRQRAYVYREADGVTAEEARSLGAAKNIADGNGTAIDAARVLRDLGWDAERLRAEGIPTSVGTLGHQAVGLSMLGPTVWNQVWSEELPARFGALIGRRVPGFDQDTKQAQLADLVRDARSLGEASERIRLALAKFQELKVTESPEDLFGNPTEMDRLLIKEAAEVSGGIQRRLREDRAAFNNLLRNTARLEDSGAADVQGDVAAEQRDLAERVFHAFQEFSDKPWHPIGQILAESTNEYAGGEPLSSVIDSALDRLSLLDWRELDRLSFGEDAQAPARRQPAQGLFTAGPAADTPGVDDNRIDPQTTEEAHRYDPSVAGYRSASEPTPRSGVEPEPTTDVGVSNREVELEVEEQRFAENLSGDDAAHYLEQAKIGPVAEMVHEAIHFGRNAVVVGGGKGARSLAVPGGTQKVRGFVEGLQRWAQVAGIGGDRLIVHNSGSGIAELIETSNRPVTVFVTSNYDQVVETIAAELQGRQIRSGNLIQLVRSTTEAAPEAASPRAGRRPAEPAPTRAEFPLETVDEAARVKAQYAPPPPVGAADGLASSVAEMEALATEARLRQAAAALGVAMDTLKASGIAGAFQSARDEGVSEALWSMATGRVPSSMEISRSDWERGAQAARDHFAFVQLCCFDHARANDPAMVPVLTAYFRVLEGVARDEPLSAEDTTLLEAEGLWRANAFDPAGVDKLNDWFDGALSEAHDQVDPSVSDEFFSGIDPRAVTAPLRWLAKDSGLFSDVEVDGNEFRPARMLRLQRMIDTFGEAMPRRLRSLLRGVNSLFGRQWDSGAFPRSVAEMNRRAVNEVYSPAASRKAEALFYTEHVLGQLSQRGFRMPRRHAHAFTKLIDSGAFKNMESPADVERVYGPGTGYLFGLAGQMVDVVNALGQDLVELGYMKPEQYAKWRDQYAMRASLRADERDVVDRLREGDITALLPNRDLSRATDGSQDGAVRIVTPELLFLRQNTQEATVRHIFEVLHGLRDRGLAFPFSDFDRRNGAGRPIWKPWHREYFEVAAMNGDIRNPGVYVDPVNGRDVNGRQQRLFTYLRQIQDGMQTKEDHDAGTLTPGKHPWTPEKQQLLDDWLGAEGRPGLCCTEHIARELDMLFTGVMNVPPATASAAQASREGLLVEHMWRRVDELARYWRRAVTVQNPVHWTLNITSSVMTNHLLGKVSAWDFVRSMVFGRGSYADAMQHISWWTGWNEAGRPTTESGLPDVPASQQRAVQQVHDVTNLIMGGSFVSTMIESGALHEMIGSAMQADTVTRDLQATVAAAGMGSTAVMDAALELGRRMSQNQAGRDVAMARALGARDPEGRAQAITDWTAQYQMWELLFKYAATLNKLRKNPVIPGQSPAERLSRAAQSGAEGTADYRNVSPYLRRWTTMMNVLVNPVMAGTERHAHARSLLRFLTASPFRLYDTVMMPAKLHALAARPWRAAAVGGFGLLLAHAIWMRSAEGADDEWEAWRTYAGSRGAEGTPIVDQETVDKLLEALPENYLPHPGGLTTEPGWRHRGLWRMALRMMAGEPFVAETVPRGSQQRMTSVEDLTPGWGDVARGFRSGRNLLAGGGSVGGERLAALYGLQPQFGLAFLQGGFNVASPPAGRTRWEQAVREGLALASGFAPLFNSNTWALSRQSRRALEASLLDGQDVLSYFRGLQQVYAPTARERFWELAASNVWRSRAVYPYDHLREGDGWVVSALRETLPHVRPELGAQGQRWRRATKLVVEQGRTLVQDSYERWRRGDYDSSTPTLDSMIAGEAAVLLDAQWDGQAWHLRPEYTGRQGMPAPSVFGRLAQRQSDPELRSAILEFAIEWTAGPAWQERGRDVVLQLARERRVTPDLLGQLYESAVKDPDGRGLLQLLHREIVDEGRTDRMAELYPVFATLEAGRFDEGPAKEDYADLWRLFDPPSRGAVTRPEHGPTMEQLFGPAGRQAGFPSIQAEALSRR